MECHGESFAWKSPPYEYEYERLPIDLILGDSRIRERLSAGDTVETLEVDWQSDLDAFDTLRQKYLLYP